MGIMQRRKPSLECSLLEQCMKKELAHRFRNPELISKSLINNLFELPALKDVNILSLRTFVDNLHNIVRMLKSCDHGADLKAAVNM